MSFLFGKGEPKKQEPRIESRPRAGGIPTRPAGPNIEVQPTPTVAEPVNVPPPRIAPSGPPPEPSYELEVRPGVFVTMPRTVALAPRVDPARYPEPSWDGRVDVDPLRGELYVQPTFNVVGKAAHVYVKGVLKGGGVAAGLRFQFTDAGHFPIVVGAIGCPGLWFGDYPHMYEWNVASALVASPEEEQAGLLIVSESGYSGYTSFASLDDKGEWVGNVRLSKPLERTITLELKVNGRALYGPGDLDSVAWRTQAWIDEMGAAVENPSLSLEMFMELARASAAAQG